MFCYDSKMNSRLVPCISSQRQKPHEKESVNTILRKVLRVKQQNTFSPPPSPNRELKAFPDDE